MAKRKRGRPPLPPGQRTSPITVYFPNADYDWMCSLSLALGKSMSRIAHLLQSFRLALAKVEWEINQDQVLRYTEPIYPPVYIPNLPQLIKAALQHRYRHTDGSPCILEFDDTGYGNYLTSSVFVRFDGASDFVVTANPIKPPHRSHTDSD